MPFHESPADSATLRSASQIVYPACTVPPTRGILYYRVEYLMSPATLGTRGKKFVVPPLPRDISHRRGAAALLLLLLLPPNSFRLDFRDRRGTNFLREYATRIPPPLPTAPASAASRVTSFGSWKLMYVRFQDTRRETSGNSHELLSRLLNNRLFEHHARLLPSSSSPLDFVCRAGCT